MAPTTDPSNLLVEEANTLELDIPLRIGDRDPPPTLAAVSGLQNCGCGVVLQGHPSNLRCQELDLPAPFAGRKVDPGVLQLVFPGHAAIGSEHDHGFQLIVAGPANAADYPATQIVYK